jgi:hypothetical protein
MKLALYFILSLIVVLFTSYYQRVTGPTYEKKVHLEINNNDYEFKLIRSQEIGEPCLIKLPIADTTVKAIINYKRFPTNDTLVAQAFERVDDNLVAELPEQPAAGKLQYFITFFSGPQKQHIQQTENVVIRFKGAVPAGILVTHIIFIFLGMWFSNLTTILAIAKHDKKKIYSILTVLALFIGGMIFGPFVQKYAFDAYWTGVPFGWDLTDNKTLIAVLAWLIAIIGNLKKERRSLYIAAGIITLAVFVIPHSVMGSEFNYQQGQVTTG